MDDTFFIRSCQKEPGAVSSLPLAPDNTSIAGGIRHMRIPFLKYVCHRALLFADPGRPTIPAIRSA